MDLGQMALNLGKEASQEQKNKILSPMGYRTFAICIKGKNI